MKAKTWTKMMIGIWFFAVVLMGATVVIVDPYYHYHKPLACFEYEVGDAAYTNDGKCKNFEYDALITGTSMTSGFSEEEASEVFDKSFIRATFLGEGFKRVNENLESAISHNPDLDLVIRSLDTLWFITGPDWLGHEDYPTYLYNDKWWDDTKYLYNFDVWKEAVLPTLGTFRLAKEVPESPAGKDEKDVAEAPKEKETKEEGADLEYLKKARALENYTRPAKENLVIEEEETAQMYADLEANLEANVLRTIRENPDIEFYLYFPPYSVLWWDSINRAGEGRVERRIDFEEYVIEQLLPYENVKLFSFFLEEDLVCDLDNYSDDIHYRPRVNSQILAWMKAGEYQLTKENYETYISGMKEFYTNYDYDALFE